MPEVGREPGQTGLNVDAPLIPAGEHANSETVPEVVDRGPHAAARANSGTVAQRPERLPHAFVDHARAAKRDEEARAGRGRSLAVTEVCVALHHLHDAG